MEDLKPKTNRDGSHTSLWQDTIDTISYTQEKKAAAPYDTLIVGGGITGLTTALLLQQQGQKCLLVEAHNPGYGTTGGTTAHLNTFLDTSYPEIDSDFGEKASAQIAAAARDTINFIKNNIDVLGIDADFEFKDGYLFSQNEEETKTLDSIFSSSKKAGLDVSETSTNQLPIGFDKCICFKDQAQFHPLKYLNGLAQEFIRLGGTILNDSFIEKNEEKNGLHYAYSADGTFTARNLVYATHIPPGVNLLSLRNAPYRSYVLAVKLKDENYPDGLSYDLKEPYHYFRSHEVDGERHLIIGGADHKTGHDDPEAAFAELEAYTREHFNVESIAYKWSSQYYVPVDGLPYIGQLPGDADRIFIATGYNGNGMILGSLAAKIINDLILEQSNPLAELFNPSRLKPVAGFSEFIKENADVAYRFVADRFGNENIESLTSLAEDEGKIVELNGEKLAVYKGKDGHVSALNPVCTHAHCIVNFNPEEKSWDCPCHGGRFSIDGKVLTGPPRKDLEQVVFKKA